MRTSLRLACAISVVSLALPSAACKSAEDRAREQGVAYVLAPHEAGPEAEKRTIVVGGDAGRGSGLVMGSTKPEDFPEDIPIYPGSTVTLGGRSARADKRSWSLTVTTGDSRAQAAARYKELLAGFEKVSDLDMGDASLSIWRSAAYDMTLMIGTADNAKTTITLNVASK